MTIKKITQRNGFVISIYNPLDNNLEFYKILVHAPFTKSETEPDIYYKKPNTRVIND